LTRRLVGIESRRHLSSWPSNWSARRHGVEEDLQLFVAATAAGLEATL
jgi:hypothetical protein